MLVPVMGCPGSVPLMVLTPVMVVLPLRMTPLAVALPVLVMAVITAPEGIPVPDMV
jgi:hypothetical protein